MRGKMFTRRRFMATSAAASTTMIAAPFVKTAHAAGKLSIGFWDHFVPDANKTSDALIQAWAAKEKVEVQIDRFTANKALLTIAADEQPPRRALPVQIVGDGPEGVHGGAYANRNRLGEAVFEGSCARSR